MNQQLLSELQQLRSENQVQKKNKLNLLLAEGSKEKILPNGKRYKQAQLQFAKKVKLENSQQKDNETNKSNAVKHSLNPGTGANAAPESIIVDSDDDFDDEINAGNAEQSQHENGAAKWPPKRLSQDSRH